MIRRNVPPRISRTTSPRTRCFPGADTSARIEFEPAIGPAAPDRYRISLQWRGPRDNDEVRHAVTLILLARPVAGQA